LAVAPAEVPLPPNAFHPRTRKAWRAWLEKYHATKTGIWLVTYKKATGKPRVEYGEAVEEALCFGWVNSKPRKLDEARSMLYFAPRKAGSGWSGANKERVRRLLKLGQMRPAGIAKVDAAPDVAVVAVTPDAAPEPPAWIPQFLDLAAGTVMIKQATREQYAGYLASLDATARAKATPLKDWSDERPNELVGWVTFEQAQGFCRAADASLLSKEEWLALAEGGWRIGWPVAGETVVTPNGVKILGPRNLPSDLARHASQMYARNLLNFLQPAIKNGELAIDWQDEVFAQSVLTHDGSVKHAGTAKLLGG
jgi:hypothetical protein